MTRRWARRHGTTALLLGAAAVLAVWVFIDRPPSNTGSSPDRARRLFSEWRADEIRQVELQRRDGQWTLAPSPSSRDGPLRWTLQHEHQSVDPDPKQVHQFLSTLELASYERVVSTTGVDPDAMGLDRPRLVIQVLTGNERHTLRVGTEAPSPADSLYADVQAPGGAHSVYVVSRQLVEALETVPLRSRRLVPRAARETDEVALLDAASKEVRWRLVRGGWPAPDAAAFELRAAVPFDEVRANHRTVGALFVALGLLEATAFLTGKEPPAIDGGGPRFVLMVKPRASGEPTLRLELGGRCPQGSGVVAWRSGGPRLAACVGEKALQAIDLPASQFVDRHVLGSLETDIVELQVRRAERAAGQDQPAETVLEVARKGTGWHVRSPSDLLVDADAIDRWVQSLVALRGTLVSPGEGDGPAERGLAPPRATLRIVSLGRATTIAGSTAERIEVVQIGHERSGELYVRRQEDAAVLKLDADAEGVLLPDHATLRSAKIYDVPVHAFRKLRIRTGEMDQRFAREPTGAWTLEHPTGTGLGADLTLISNLLQELGKLQALRWVGESDADRFGLSHPWCIIEAEFDRSSVTADRGQGGAAPDEVPSGGAKLRVVLGAPTQGGFYARRDDHRAVFVAPRGVGDDARHWLLDRSATMVNVDTAVRVILERGQARLEFVRDGERWHVADAGDTGSGQAHQVLQALRDLLSEGVVRLGAPEPAEGFAGPVFRIRVERRGEDEPTVLIVGAGDVWRNTNVFYLRRQGVDATFVVAHARLRPLMDLL